MWWFRVCLSVGVAKNVSWLWLSPLRGWGSLTIIFPGKFMFIWLTISSNYGSILLTLVVIRRDGGFSTLCHSCGFACQERVLKTFPGSDYLRSENGVVWLWHFPVNLWKYDSPFYIYIYTYNIYICIYIYIWNGELYIYVLNKLQERSTKLGC